MSDDIEERPGGLAGAFLDMEDERQQSIADARDTRRRRHARHGRGRHDAAPSAGARRCGDLRDARRDRGGRQPRGRDDEHVVARHPRLARAERRGDHLHHLRLVGVPHPRRAAHGVARRPVPAWAHHRVLEPLLRADDGADRPGDERCRAVLRSARRRFDEVEHVHRAEHAPRRHLPDHVERARRQHAQPVRVGDRHAQPADRRRNRHVDRWSERVAVGVRPAVHSDLHRLDLRVPAPRTASRAVREAGRAR